MGRNYCAICDQYSGQNGVQRQFFPIPYNNEAILKKWESTIGRCLKKEKETHVCQGHFVDSDFAVKVGQTKRRPKLTPCAVPSVNLAGPVVTMTKKRKSDDPGTIGVKMAKHVPTILKNKSSKQEGPDQGTDGTSVQMDSETASEETCPGLATVRHSTPLKSSQKVTMELPPMSPVAPDTSTDFESSHYESKDHVSEDPDYQPSMLSTFDETAEEISTFDGCDSADEDTKLGDIKFVVVDIGQLDSLLINCKECGQLNELDKKRSGAVLTYNCECPNGHKQTWQTTKKQKQLPVFNVLIAAALFCTGIGFTPFKKCANALGLAFFSESTFYAHIRNYTAPVIRNDWVIMRRKNLTEMLAAIKKAILSGDARFDSPGHCAKYSLYTIMNNLTNKIVDFVLWQKGFEDGEMESKSFFHVFSRVVKELGKTNISIFCSDRNASVGAVMKSHFKDIVHEFDVWHLSKTLRKKLVAASKKLPQLAPWIPAIRNHLWFSAGTCNGDEALLLKKWRAMVYHLRGIHSWKEDGKQVCCEHEPLTPEKQEWTKWIDGEAALAALKKITQNTRFVNQLRHCKNFIHTGNLESYHSLCLAYAPKRLHFQYDNMVLRTILAIFDHNYNVDRQIIGEKSRYSKASKTYNLQNVYEKKSEDWRVDLIWRVRDFAINPSLLGNEEEADLLLSPPYPLPQNIAGVERPSSEELAAKKEQRRNAAEKQGRV